MFSEQKPLCRLWICRTPAEDFLYHHLYLINHSRWASGLVFVIILLECCEISPADEDTAGTPVNTADPLFEGDGPCVQRADTCTPPGYLCVTLGRF